MQNKFTKLNSSGKGFTFNKIDCLKFQFDPNESKPNDEGQDNYLSEIKKV